MAGVLDKTGGIGLVEPGGRRPFGPSQKGERGGLVAYRLPMELFLLPAMSEENLKVKNGARRARRHPNFYTLTIRRCKKNTHLVVSIEQRNVAKQARGCRGSGQNPSRWGPGKRLRRFGVAVERSAL